MAKAASPLERKLAAAVTRFLKAKGDELADTLGGKLGLAKSDPSMDDYSQRFDSAFDEVDWDWAPLAEIVEPTIAGIAVAAGKNATSELGLFDKATLAKMTANASAYAETRSAEMIGRKRVDGELVENEGWSIPSATRDMIRSDVVHAMESGASNQELAATIRESEAFSKVRAMTIARTETAKAETQGSIAGWKASGLVAGKQFIAAPECCADCQELDGEIVPLDDEFQEGDPPVHPNCRCAILPVLNDEMPDSGEDDEG